MKEYRVVFWKLAAIREAVGGSVRVEEGRETDELLALLRGKNIRAYDAIAYAREVPAIEKFSFGDERDVNPAAVENVRATTLAQVERILQRHKAEGWRILRQDRGDEYYGWGLTTLERKAR
jgi:hypothetical protein